MDNPDKKKDYVKGNLNGILTVITYADNNPPLDKNSALKKLVKKKEAGELESWIQKEVSKKDY